MTEVNLISYNNFGLIGSIVSAPVKLAKATANTAKSVYKAAANSGNTINDFHNKLKSGANSLGKATGSIATGVDLFSPIAKDIAPKVKPAINSAANTIKNTATNVANGMRGK